MTILAGLISLFAPFVGTIPLPGNDLEKRETVI
jgi:hypothetical protein